MTSNVQPPDDVVDFFLDVTNCKIDRDHAVKRLKAHNNNADQALNEFLNDPEDQASKYSWDDSPFAADHEKPGASYSVQGPDVVAPTRPPSRANNRSPLGAPANAEQYDADLQRALAESAADSGLPPQETGVVNTDTNAPQFGPANRPHYDENQWGVVATGKPHVDSADAEPPPSARRRDPEQPAVLRATGRPDDGRLAGVVTILHNIPLARNMMLSVGQPADRYGHYSEWWKGKPILDEQKLAAISRGEEPQGGHPSFAAELHRLVAFLDGTDRSCGSARSLAGTETITHGTWSSDPEGGFLEALSTEQPAGPGDGQALLWQARVEPITRREAGAEEQMDPGYESNGADNPTDECDQPFTLLDVTLTSQQPSSLNSLYDTLDYALFWRSALLPGEQAATATFPGELNMAFLKKLGDILPIRIKTCGFLQEPLEIPAVFYTDRYCEAQREQAVQIQYLMHSIRAKEARLEEWTHEKMQCTGEQGCRDHGWLPWPHSKSECYKKIIGTSEYALERQRKRAQWRYYDERSKQGHPYNLRDIRHLSDWSGPYQLNEEEQKKQEDLEHIVRASKEKLAEVDRVAHLSDERRKHCLNAFKVLGRRFTCREDEASPGFARDYIQPSRPECYNADWWNPKHKYLLRGLAASDRITYVCTRERRDAELIELEGQTGPKDQWWRIECAATDSGPVKIAKTDLEAVLVAAGSESQEPLVVYASEAAMDAAPMPLSAALRNFVRFDNKAFLQELAQEERQETENRYKEQQSLGPQGNSEGGAAGLATDDVNQPEFLDPSSLSKSRRSSSAATVGSARSSRELDTDMEDLCYDEGARPAHDSDQAATAVHEEFAGPRQHSSAPLSNIKNWLSTSQHVQDSQAGGPGGRAPTAPEMSERLDGHNPFIGRPSAGNDTQSTAADMMEISEEELDRLA